jgi:ABC-type enterochelin transport system permease subunit
MDLSPESVRLIFISVLTNVAIAIAGPTFLDTLGDPGGISVVSNNHKEHILGSSLFTALVVSVAMYVSDKIPAFNINSNHIVMMIGGLWVAHNISQKADLMYKATQAHYHSITTASHIEQ